MHKLWAICLLLLILSYNAIKASTAKVDSINIQSAPYPVSWVANDGWSNILFRDIERNNNVSLAISDNLSENIWSVHDIYPRSVGEWEPSYDTELWKRKQCLDIYLQEVEQVDGEGKANRAPTKVGVLQWKPNKKGD